MANFFNSKNVAWVSKPFVLFIIFILVVQMHVSIWAVKMVNTIEAATDLPENIIEVQEMGLLPASGDQSHMSKGKEEDKKENALTSMPGEILLGLKDGATISGVLDEVGLRDVSHKRIQNIEPVVKRYIKKNTLKKEDGSNKGWYWFLGRKYEEINDIDNEDAFKAAYNEMDEVEKKLYRAHKIKIGKDAAVDVAVATLKKSENVVYAEPNYVYQINSIPQDPRYNEQWAHTVTQAETLWAESDAYDAGDKTVVVAVIDTGVAYDHEDLAASMWRDNEGNCGADFVNFDIETYEDMQESSYYTLYDDEDYLDFDNDPADFFGHGTHCAGIIGAVAHNGVGITGVSQQCAIMAIRTGFVYEYYNFPYGWTQVAGLSGDAIIQGVVYAVDNSADVISMSYGGYVVSQAEEDVYDYAEANGVLLIAAAGNNNSSVKSYPAGYDNVFAVAATGADDVKAEYSNYGDWVDVAAPGGDSNNDTTILSTVPSVGPNADSSGYGFMQGTSMACPYVAGLAGLILAQDEYAALTADEVYARICGTADNVNELTYSAGLNGPIGSGRVNVYNAITQEEQQLISIINYEVEDGWTAQGDTENVTCTIENQWLGASNVQLSVTSEDSFITVNTPHFSVGNLAMNELSEVVISFEISEEASVGAAFSLVCMITADGFQKEEEFSFTVKMPLQSGFSIVGDEERAWSSLDIVRVCDMDSDGNNEVIFTAGGNLHVYDKNGDVIPGWPKEDVEWEEAIDENTNHFYRKSFDGQIAIGDIDKNGSNEIVAFSRVFRRIETDGATISSTKTSASILIFNKAGETLSEITFNEEYEKHSGLVLVDVDNDEMLDIVFTRDNTLYAMTSAGGIIDGWPIEIEDGSLLQHIYSAGDIDSDGLNEIIIVKSREFDSSLREGNGTSKAIAFRSDGTVYWEKEVYGCTYTNVVICDLDSDGMSEIVFCTSAYYEDEEDWPNNRNRLPAQLHILRFDGTDYVDPVDVSADFDRTTFNTVFSLISLGDVDGDSDFEIVFGDSNASRVHVYHHDGTTVEGWPKTIEQTDFMWGFGAVASSGGVGHTAPVLADITGDGMSEIIIGGWFTDEIKAWRGDGTCVEGFPIALGITYLEWLQIMPSVADIDSDGDMELLNMVSNAFWPNAIWPGAEFNQLVVFDLPAEYSLDAIDTGEYHVNKENTGCYLNSEPVIVTNEDLENVQGRSPLTVYFDASESFDPDGHSLSFLWNFGDPEGSGSNYASYAIAEHTYEIPSDSGDVIFDASVTVTDSKGKSAMKTLPIEVLANHSPEITNGIAGQIMNEGEILTLSVDVTDLENDVCTLSVSGNLSASGASWYSVSGTDIMFTPGSGDAGYSEFTVVATDTHGGVSEEVTFSLIVNADIEPPVVAITSHTMLEQLSYDDFVFRGTATDNVGIEKVNIIVIVRSLSGGWEYPYGYSHEISVENGEWEMPISKDEIERGDSVILVVLQTTSDVNGNMMSGLSQYRVVTINQSPIITAIDDQSMDEGVELAISVVSSDADGEVANLSYEGLPSFASPTEDGILLSPLASDSGEYEITVTATDDLGATAEDTFILTVNDDATPPVIAITSHTMGQAVAYDDFSFRGTATDNVGIEAINVILVRHSASTGWWEYPLGYSHTVNVENGTWEVPIAVEDMEPGDAFILLVLPSTNDVNGNNFPITVYRTVTIDDAL